MNRLLLLVFHYGLVIIGAFNVVCLGLAVWARDLVWVLVSLGMILLVALLVNWAWYVARIDR